MAKPEIAMNQYLRKKRHFADIYNVNCFGGRQVITPNSLRELKRETDIIIKNQGISYLEINTEAVQRRRDIIMEWDNSVILILLACELQSVVSHAMPVRCMLYDAMTYTDQMQNIWNSLSSDEQKRLPRDEFFSRFRKKDRLFPVITLVVYYGEEEWDGSLELYDMFKIEDKSTIDALRPLVANYKVNLVDLNHPYNLQAYRSDLGIVFGMAQYRNDKNAMKQYVNAHNNFFSNTDFETTNAIQAIIRGNRAFTRAINENRTEKGGCDMCKALEDLCNDSYNEGIEFGISQGMIASLKQTIAILQAQNVDNNIIDAILSAQNLTKSDLEQ